MVKKKLVKNKIERVFHRPTTIFGPYKDDTKDVIKQSSVHDFNFWKAKRLVKTGDDIEQQQKACEDVYFQYFKEVKNCFMQLLS